MPPVVLIFVSYDNLKYILPWSQQCNNQIEKWLACVLASEGA